MKNLNPIKVRVTRAELRNRKIIFTLEPDLLTGEEFAVNPYYDEGSDKNKLEKIKISVFISEENGVIKAEAKYSNEFHYTTGHTQIHGLNNGYYLSKKECAIDEIINSRYECIENDEGMNKLLSNWNGSDRFELETLIEDRKNRHYEEELNNAMEEYDTAMKTLKEIFFKKGLKHEN